MSLLDIAILAVLALGALRGLLRGLIKEAAALTALLLGGWLAFRYHEKAAVLLHGMLPPVAARMVAFILLLGWVNRLGGMVLGCLEGALVLGMFFYAVVAVPFSFPFKETVQKHPFAHPLASFGGSTLDRAKTLRQQSP